MHPHMISALARERHAELLRARHFRDTDGLRSRKRWRRPVQRARHAVGSALVLAGTRLIAPDRRAPEWVVHASRDSTLR
jgi:hypothetical protein